MVPFGLKELVGALEKSGKRREDFFGVFGEQNEWRIGWRKKKQKGL